MGNFDKAIKDFSKAIELDPKNAYAYNNRGLYKYHIQDKAGAIEDYNKAIELDPNNREAYFNKANYLFDLGNKSGACANWTKAGELGYTEALERVKKFCN